MHEMIVAMQGRLNGRVSLHFTVLDC